MCIVFFKFFDAEAEKDGAQTAGQAPASTSSSHEAKKYRFVLAANRDEFAARPTAPAHIWDGGEILAGEDLEKPGGTWLGVTQTGRFAALTNFREKIAPHPRGRGFLVSEFLKSSLDPISYIRTCVMPVAQEYAGFNLLLIDFSSLHCAYFSNRSSDIIEISDSSVHALCNASLDTPWPKLVLGKTIFSNICSRLDSTTTAATPTTFSATTTTDDNTNSDNNNTGSTCASLSFSPSFTATATFQPAGPLDPSTESLLDELFNRLLSDSTTFDDSQLPRTSAPVATERSLCSIKVDTRLDQKEYGTRSQAVLLVETNGRVVFSERSLDLTSQARPPPSSTRTFTTFIPVK